MMQEYIVTLRSHAELEEFYDDMETPGGSLYIPDREVDIALRRPVSRNTHYMLTVDEVETLKNDPRVLDIISKEEYDSRTIEPEYSQTGRFDKDLFITSQDLNWALLRCTEGLQRPNWGDNSTNNQTATIKLTSAGRNVDVVIMDGHINPNHPEYAVNPDGTGGSRVNQFNWYTLTSQVTGGQNGTYSYPSGVSLENDDDNHGAHVAGTACGNTQGWARQSTIYNISPYGTNPNTTAATYCFDYVRVWHLNKPINPATGKRNPTIVNMSFGSTNTITRSTITNVTHRGTSYNTFTDPALDLYGLVSYDSTTLRIPAEQFTASTVDIEDMISAGIIVVGSAGNRSYKQTRSGDVDYNNTITYSGVTRYYHRGDFRFGSNIICVGAISALVNESKATFSHCGNRVDVFAPGVNIISSVHSDPNSTNDARNISYKLAKYDGTSMASPQVTGVIACVLEQYPRMTQSNVLDYLNQHSKVGQMTSTAGGYTDKIDLQGASNKFLFFNKERKESGPLQPRETNGSRPTSGQSYPRRATLHYKK
jgi:subtilisin family serine protease